MIMDETNDKAIRDAFILIKEENIITKRRLDILERENREMKDNFTFSLGQIFSLLDTKTDKVKAKNGKDKLSSKKRKSKSK